MLAAILAGDTTASTTHAVAKHVAPFLLVPIACWLFLSERYERTLAALLLYLALLDGVIKLSSGSNVATLGRDALLYAIVLGAIARMILRRTRVAMPRLSGFVLAWIAVCLMQVANPAGVSITHSLASLRQHIEFVPLFFGGYYVLRSQKRLTALLVLLVIVAAVNGIVGLIQSGLSPHQLASWGPGYAKLELGTGTSVSRTFVSANGQTHVRPPGLGGTDGFGGLVCLIALPAAAVLLANMRRATRFSWLLIPCTALAVAGIVTSQERVIVVGSVIAIAAYLALTFTSRRWVGALVVAIVVGFTAFLVGSAVLSSSANRYSSITPTNIFSATSQARGGSIKLLPTYMVRYPLGAGLGSVGPAAASGFGGAPTKSLNGETEFNFLVVETGIPGLLVMLAFSIASLRTGIALRRTLDPELQRSLMALTAVLIALLVIWFDAPVTADSPSAPFIWLSAGCLVYWYHERLAGRVKTAPRRVQAALALRR